MYKCLKDRNFSLIITGKFISIMGNSVFDIAVVWYILSAKGALAGNALAHVMIAASVPGIVLGGIAGAVVDRLDRKTVLVLSDLSSAVLALVLFGFYKLDMLYEPVILAATALLSALSMTVRIAVNSLIPEFFDEDGIYSANAANQFVERVTSIAGFACGGLLVSLLGIGGVFILDAVSFLACAAFEMSAVFPSGNPEKSSSSQKNSFIEDFKAAVGFLAVNRKIVTLLLMFALVNFIWDPLLNIALPYALKNQFEITPWQFGVLQAAMPLGFCLGAFLFSHKGGFIKSRSVIFRSVLAVNTGVALLLAPSASGIARPYSGWPVWYMAVILAITGVFSSAINISTSSLMQEKLPASIRGKLIGIMGSLTAGLFPVGCSIAGLLLGRVSTPMIFFYSAVIIFAAILFIPRESYSIEGGKPGIALQDIV